MLPAPTPVYSYELNETCASLAILSLRQSKACAEGKGGRSARLVWETERSQFSRALMLVYGTTRLRPPGSARVCQHNRGPKAGRRRCSTRHDAAFSDSPRRTVVVSRCERGTACTPGQRCLRRLHLLQPCGRQQACAGAPAWPTAVRQDVVPGAGAADLPRRDRAVRQPSPLVVHRSGARLVGALRPSRFARRRTVPVGRPRGRALVYREVVRAN